MGDDVIGGSALVIGLLRTILAATLCLGSAFAIARPHEIADLSFASIRLVDPSSAEDRPFYEMLSWLREPLLVVELTTERDLLSYIKEGDYTLYARVFFCDRSDGSRLEIDPYVYDDVGIVERDRSSMKSIGPDKRSYKVVVRPKVDEPKQMEAVAYNLIQTNEDICLQLRGGRMTGGSFSSNVVRLPSGTVRSVF
jgi:hypothetical protein